MFLILITGQTYNDTQTELDWLTESLVNPFNDNMGSIRIQPNN